MTATIDAPSVDSAAFHVMIVDDEDDYHLITRMMLKKAGFTGRFSAFLDPMEAIEYLRSTGERPDLLLVDINMPGTDGFEFLHSCQKDNLLECSETTVVMCSSSNHPTDLDMARQQPCISEYIEKPLTTEQFARIAESIGQRIQGRNQT